MRSSLLIFIACGCLWPAAAPAAVPGHGDLVITEIAANPALPEPAAEYVVVDNASGDDLLLDGVRLTDAAGGTRGAVPAHTSLEPGQRIVLQPSGGPAAYGCAPPGPHRALLAGWAPLNNDGDTVALERADGAVLDRVVYPRDGFATEARSRRLDPAFRTPAGNDVWARWAASPLGATPCGLAAPRPGRVRFTLAEVSAGERAGSVRVTLQREGGTNGRLVVPFHTADGSAAAGRDYTGVSGGVAIGATETTSTLTVPILDDARDEATESFTVVLGGDATSEPSRAVVRVADDDAPAGPVLTPTLPGSPFPAPPPRPGGSAPYRPPGNPLAPAHWPPPSGTTAGDGTRRSWLGVAAWQRILRRGRILAAVSCEVACTMETEGDVALGRGRYVRLKPVRRRLEARTVVMVRLRVPGRRVRTVRRALRRRGWLRATVTATPEGGSAAERRVRVR